MTCREIENALTAAGIAEAAEEAAILVDAFGGIAPYELPFRSAEDIHTQALQAAVERRLHREPLQYILGHWSFHGLEFALNPDCLCPRADTETLVDLAIARLPEGATFCDIGTGSGAIAVSILHDRPDLRAIAVDISEGALSCAQENALKNGVADRCTFVLCNALDPAALAALGPVDAVVSNPPYIPTEVIPTLAPELAFEPHRALDGGEDGLTFYRGLLSSPMQPKSGLFLFEIGYDQGEALCRLAASHGYGCEIRKDLGGKDRVAIITTIA